MLEPLDQVRTMRLYTMDAWVSDPAVLSDEPRLRAALHAGARAGGATVLGEEFCVFLTAPSPACSCSPSRT
jgi:hypothetical protein